MDALERGAAWKRKFSEETRAENFRRRAASGRNGVA